MGAQQMETMLSSSYYYRSNKVNIKMELITISKNFMEPYNLQNILF